MREWITNSLRVSDYTLSEKLARLQESEITLMKSFSGAYLKAIRGN
jgi:hypothetical protein